MKIVAHNKRLRRVIRSRIRPVWVRNEKMIIGTAQGLHWSPDEHDLMIARFIEALYYHCFKRSLPLHVPVEASRQQPFTAKVLDMWRSWPGENIGSGGECRYHYLALEDPENSIWMLTFYDRHFASGWADGLVPDFESDPLGRRACRDHTLRPARRGCAACHRHEARPTMMV